jgi:PUA-domain protein
MQIKNRHFIQKSQIRDLKEEVLKQYDETFLNQVFPRKAHIELIQTEEGDELFAINNKLKLWKTKRDGYIPVLTFLLNNEVKIKSITVDMPAIKYITNGADVMRPGVKKIEEGIEKGDIVQVVDETHNRAIAVGKALFSTEDMQIMSSGKVVKNIHTIQDSVWKFEKDFK